MSFGDGIDYIILYVGRNKTTQALAQGGRFRQSRCSLSETPVFAIAQTALFRPCDAFLATLLFYSVF